MHKASCTCETVVEIIDNKLSENKKYANIELKNINKTFKFTGKTLTGSLFLFPRQYHRQVLFEINLSTETIF